jgi:hypothetical protein
MSYDKLIDLVASEKRQERFYTFDGRGFQCLVMDVSEEPESSEKITKRVRDYDLQVLYQIYLMCEGSIDKMCAFKDAHSELQNVIPQRSTLFKLSNKYNWQAQKAKVWDACEEDLNSKNSLSFSRIDKLAGYMYSMFIKRLMQAAQDGDYGIVKMSDLQAVWEMSRTERGKAVRIPASMQVSDPMTHRKDLLQSMGDESSARLLKAIEKLPNDVRQKFMEDFSGKKTQEVPKLLNRDKR